MGFFGAAHGWGGVGGGGGQKGPLSLKSVIHIHSRKCNSYFKKKKIKTSKRLLLLSKFYLSVR